MLANKNFPKVRKMLLFLAPFKFNTLLASFAGTLLLPLCLLLRPILKCWRVGAALMRFTWANQSERRILVSNFCVTCNSFCDFYTSDRFPYVSDLPENKHRRLHVLKDATPIVVNSMICTQQVHGARDVCHGKQRVAQFYRASHTSST